MNAKGTHEGSPKGGLELPSADFIEGRHRIEHLERRYKGAAHQQGSPRALRLAVDVEDYHAGCKQEGFPQANIVLCRTAQTSLNKSKSVQQRC
jgi:hypothetical protein